MPSQTGLELLSALRRAGSTSAIRDTPESFFVEDDEKAAFVYLRDHVRQHRAFPTSDMIYRETGVRTITTGQPLNYYMDRARQRALYNACMTPFGSLRDAMDARTPDEFVKVCREVVAMAARMQRSSADYTSIEAAIDIVRADFDEASMVMGLRGIPTGWEFMDAQTNGFQNDDLIALVGRIGTGKTYILLHMAFTAWLAGYNVLFASMELGVLQLIRRMVGLYTKINPNLIRSGRLSTVVQRDFREQLSAMSSTGIPFNTIAGGMRKSVETLRGVAEATSPDIIFCDAAYLLRPETRRRSDSRRETISDTLEDLNSLKLDLSRPINISVQFNRKAEPLKKADNENATPVSHLNLSKIGETDVIGQVCSLVLGAAPDFSPHDSDRRVLKFMKGREGEGGIWQIKYEFSPVCFDFIQEGYGQRSARAAEGERPDLSHML